MVELRSVPSALQTYVLSIVRYFFLLIRGLNFISAWNNHQHQLMTRTTQKDWQTTPPQSVSLLIPATQGTMAWKFQHWAAGLFPGWKKSCTLLRVVPKAELFQSDTSVLGSDLSDQTYSGWKFAPLWKSSKAVLHSTFTLQARQTKSTEPAVLPNDPQQEGVDLRPGAPVYLETLSMGCLSETDI